MDDESCDAKSMENIFSSYCNQKKVPRQLLMSQSVEVVRSLPHDIKYITLKLAVGFNSYKLLGWTKMETRFPHRLGWFQFYSMQILFRRFKCLYAESLYFHQYKYRNRVSFENNGIRDCCRTSWNHVLCLARKYVAYSSAKVANIYYIDDHTCSPRDIDKWLL